MVTNATPTNEQSAEQVTDVLAGFAPQVAVHSVDALTLGRQTFNDADKSNWFEG